MPATDGSGPTIRTLIADLNAWVGELMSCWVPSSTREARVIRDPIHGFIRLAPHEAELLDTPLMQRLRYISQNGLARLVYPGMAHSRLDHSLGVLQTAQLMMDSLVAQGALVDPRTRVHVRMAALLHDVGHVLFSHMGEEVLERLLPDLFQTVRREDYADTPRFFHSDSGRDVPSGEILSFLLITSESFRDVVQDQIFSRIPIADVSPSTIDLEAVGNMIMGKEAPGFPPWASDLINGSFDADKLDYIMRDCHYSGVEAEVDTSRLIHSLRVVREGAGDWSGALSVAGGSLNYLEQILLAKITLYVAIYHHQKIRSIECMFKSVFDKLPVSATGAGQLVRPSRCVDFLSLTEFDFWSRGLQTPGVQDLIRTLYERRLLRRCLVLDRTTVKERSWGRLENLKDELNEDPSEQENLRDLIYNELPQAHQHGAHHLWIDFPEPPDVDNETRECPIQLSPQIVRAMSDVVPSIDDWIKSYVVNKGRGHVFYVPDLAARQAVATKAEELLRTRYNIELETPLARAALKDIA